MAQIPDAVTERLSPRKSSPRKKIDSLPSYAQPTTSSKKKKITVVTDDQRVTSAFKPSSFSGIRSLPTKLKPGFAQRQTKRTTRKIKDESHVLPHHGNYATDAAGAAHHDAIKVGILSRKGLREVSGARHTSTSFPTKLFSTFGYTESDYLAYHKQEVRQAARSKAAFMDGAGRGVKGGRDIPLDHDHTFDRIKTTSDVYAPDALHEKRVKELQEHHAAVLGGMGIYAGIQPHSKMISDDCMMSRWTYSMLRDFTQHVVKTMAAAHPTAFVNVMLLQEDTGHVWSGNVDKAKEVSEMIVLFNDLVDLSAIKSTMDRFVEQPVAALTVFRNGGRWGVAPDEDVPMSVPKAARSVSPARTRPLGRLDGDPYKDAPIRAPVGRVPAHTCIAFGIHFPWSRVEATDAYSRVHPEYRTRSPPRVRNRTHMTVPLRLTQELSLDMKPRRGGRRKSVM